MQKTYKKQNHAKEKDKQTKTMKNRIKKKKKQEERENNNHYDIAIIGAGISGLYAAYKILKKSPQKRIILLEKASRIGGRVQTALFANQRVIAGAGVGLASNRHLVKLLKEMKIPIKTYPFQSRQSPLLPVFDMHKAVQKLLQVYRDKGAEGAKNRSNKDTLSVKEFATPLLGGPEKYKEFVDAVGYADFDDQDVYDFLYHYGITDFHERTMITMPWDLLLQRLVRKVGRHRIHLNQEVELLDQEVESSKDAENMFKLHINKTERKIITATTVLITTPVDTIRKLVPPESVPIYDRIVGQPFMRVYGKFDPNSTQIMQSTVTKYTTLPPPLQKIIPTNVEKGIYMISYCDNRNAELLHPHKENNEENRAFFAKELEKALALEPGILKLQEIRAFYWHIGTHCYKPMKKGTPFANYLRQIQHPDPNKRLFLVGETVSNNHGWCEGALDSVERIIHHL